MQIRYSLSIMKSRGGSSVRLLCKDRGNSSRLFARAKAAALSGDSLCVRNLCQAGQP
ncbi:Dynein light chain [Psidium guajava]|nr:Dynein light chain [Psidium guajava]